MALPKTKQSKTKQKAAPSNTSKPTAPTTATTKPKEPVIALAVKPLACVARNIEWLTNSTKGGKYFALVLALAGLGYSTESLYGTLNYGSKNPSQYRFMPKPFLNDGANFGNLINADYMGIVAGGVGDAMLQNPKPKNAAKKVETDRPQAVTDSKFWCAFVLTLLITYFEARAIRAVSPEVKIAEANQKAKLKAPVPDKDAIKMAHIAATEADYAGAGHYAAGAILIVMTYLIEFALAMGGLRTANGPLPAKLFWGLATVFMAELGFHFSEVDTKITDIANGLPKPKASTATANP